MSLNNYVIRVEYKNKMQNIVIIVHKLYLRIY